MGKAQRTVAALLNCQQKGLRNRVKYRKQPRHTYIFCRSSNIARLFLVNAAKEGFSFGNGDSPHEKETSDLFTINDDFTISYLGWAGHVLFKNAGGNIVRIDYGKYLSGAKDYIM